MKEFTHIEIRAVRNPEWLKEREKKGFFLSFDFPVGEFELPEGLEDLTEKELGLLRASLLTLVVLKRIPDLEKFLASFANESTKKE